MKAMNPFGMKRRQVGLTLVEILVALVVSLILIAGVIQIFVGTQQTYRFQDALARVQENGRYAIEVISRDARIAGYAGCTSLISVTPRVIAPVAVAYSLDNYINNVPAAGPALGAIAGTDVLTLRMLSPNATRVAVDMGSAADVVNLDANPDGLELNDIVGIADCNNVDLFRVNGVGAGPALTPHAPLTKAYLEGTVVSRFREVSYYIRAGASGDPALWRRELGADELDQELVDGVEDLWIRYGVDLDNNGAPDAYVDAAAVADWNLVRSLRISLLLVSNEDNVTGGPQPVNFRGAAVAVGDNRYRQVLTTTVGLRNRLP